MIYLVCHQCKAGLRVSPGEPGEIESLLEVDPSTYCPKNFFCFKCGKVTSTLVTPEEGSLNSRLRGIELFDVTPHEAFAAINGLGLPGEQDCSATAVAALLLDKTVKNVNTRVIRNSHRCIIDSIEFEDGTKMYFGASAMGATVYRISPRHSYVEEVERG